MRFEEFAPLKVTDIAPQIVTRYGMSELGQADLERQGSSFLGEQAIALRDKDYSEQTAREVDLCIQALIDAAYTRA